MVQKIENLTTEQLELWNDTLEATFRRML